MEIIEFCAKLHLIVLSAMSGHISTGKGFVVCTIEEKEK
jgi:hypothetical protein